MNIDSDDKENVEARYEGNVPERRRKQASLPLPTDALSPQTAKEEKKRICKVSKISSIQIVPVCMTALEQTKHRMMNVLGELAVGPVGNSSQ